MSKKSNQTPGRSRPRTTGQAGRLRWAKRIRSYRPGGCRTIPDSTSSQISALEWIGGEGRDSLGNAEIRATALLKSNKGILRDFGIEADVVRRNGEPVIVLDTSTRIGAFPLLSPLTGNPDFGLIVEPRFSWDGIGNALSTTGFSVVPQMLPLPELPQSDRRVPSWVISAIVLARVKAMLHDMTRRFEITNSDLHFPKGNINWTKYVTQSLTRGCPDSVPCSYPDLRDDKNLKSAIHYVLDRHHASLTTQRTASIVVVKLIELCNELIRKVIDVSPIRPQNIIIETWKRGTLRTKVFKEGLQAIVWTTEDRGLAGMSDLEGLPWRLDMKEFFEAWCEAVGTRVAKSCGMNIRVGRNEGTRIPLLWSPPYSGSQRSLLPDIILKREDLTVIIDAKYKIHAEELSDIGWGSFDDTIRENHRNDLFQVLGYSSLFDTPRILACLMYPCQPKTFESLVRRNMVISRARIPHESRNIELLLAATPIGNSIDGIVEPLTKIVRNM